jgi:hypothetical protein
VARQLGIFVVVTGSQSRCILLTQSKRRETSPPTVIPAPNYKTPHIAAVVNAIVTPESAERQPPDANLTISEDRQEHAIPLVGATPRMEKERGQIISTRRGLLHRTPPQGNTFHKG